jgi:PAS domain S-box-containing protein
MGSGSKTDVEESTFDEEWYRFLRDGVVSEMRILRCMIPAMATVGRQSDSFNIQLLVDSIPALIHTARPDGYLDYFNKPWLDYLGVTLDKVAGWNWTAFIHPDDLEGIVTEWRACLASGEKFEYETRVLRASGEFRWMFHRKVPLRDSNGNIVKWYGSSLDIDERKTADERLRRNADELQRSEFYLAEGQRLAHIGSWAFKPEGFSYWSPELFRMYGLDPAGEAPTVHEFLNRVHPNDRESMTELIKAILANASSFDATKRIVRPNGEVRYIRCVGVPAGESQGSKKFVGSAMDVTEHELLTQELRRREAYLTEAQRLSHTGSFGWRVSSGEISWSDETFRIFQCDPSTAPTLELAFSRIHPEDREWMEEVIGRASREGEAFDFEKRLQMPDGAVKHVRVTARPFRDSLGEMEFVGAITDVSEEREAQSAIRERETELRQVMEFAPQLVGVLGPNRERLFINRVALDYLGGTFEEWQEKGLTSLVHPDDLTRFRIAADRIFSNGAAAEFEIRLRNRDGNYRWFLARYNPLRDAKGQVVRWYIACTDIEDRKQDEDRLREENVALKRAEEKIRGQETELRHIMDLAPLLIGVYGPSRERLYANRTALNYLGMSLDEWRETSFAAFAYPDDSPRLKNYVDRAFSSGIADELELRIRKRDGSYRWFLVRFNPSRDEQGQITRWYSTGTDIEDRKQAEDKLRQENVALREEIDKASMFEEIVGTSPALQSVLARVSKVAPSDSTVLISGETGTGKELVARAIHRRSNRASGPFVSVNCAAVPRELIASELFGHEKGAFTGATQQRLGRFELANGGTLFLDEVGELPAETQIALLRVLQEHEFERVGGTRRIRADVRVIAATNRNLQAAITAGSFRRDLFYRLHVFPIVIPPLRDRREDVRQLVEYFIDRYARKAGKSIKGVSKRTLELLESYPWPGNIRELQNVVERSVILCDTEIFSIDESWLPREPFLAESGNQVELSEKLLAQEKNMIEAALKETRGRVSGTDGAAAKLGIPRSTLESKIRSLKIDKNRFRA